MCVNKALPSNFNPYNSVFSSFFLVFWVLRVLVTFPLLDYWSKQERGNIYCKISLWTRPGTQDSRPRSAFHWCVCVRASLSQCSETPPQLRTRCYPAKKHSCRITKVIWQLNAGCRSYQVPCPRFTSQSNQNESGKPKERFILTGGATQYDHIFQTIAKVDHLICEINNSGEISWLTGCILLG